jgi:hypothetical protein
LLRRKGNGDRRENTERRKIFKIGKITANVDELFFYKYNSKKKCGDRLKDK